MKTAIVTGASSGIGAATARLLATHGWHVWTGARRLDRLEALRREIGGECAPLDVTDLASIEEFASRLPAEIHLLVNNAGGALGLDPIAESDDAKWTRMWESNVLGLMRMTRACLPKLIAGRGHIINVTSIAGREAYPGGAGYTSVKHAARVITQTLRLELNGLPVRITDVAPGMVDTEFSVVRFDGDKDRADNVYRGLTPLTAQDIAECILWSAQRPAHVNIDEIVVKPLAQASATVAARDKGL